MARVAWRVVEASVACRVVEASLSWRGWRGEWLRRAGFFIFYFLFKLILHILKKMTAL